MHQMNTKVRNVVTVKQVEKASPDSRPAVALITAHGWVGISNPVIHTAQFMADNGYRVDIFMTPDAACEEMGISHPALEHAHIQVYTCAGSASPVQTTAVLGDVQVPLSDIEFVDTYSNNPADYQWLIGFDPGGLNRAGLLSLIWKVPYVYHSLELYENDWSGKETERWFSDKALLVLTQDETRADILAELNQVSRDKVQVAYNSAPGAATPQKKDYFHQALGIPADKRIVLATGTLLPIHGTDAIVDSVADWPDEFVLVLHGWIPERQFEAILRERISAGNGRIFLSTDILDQDHKNDIFQSADVGLVFFRPEGVNYKFAAGSSGKLFDFMRSGVPIIGNDIPGMRALVADNGCGVVVPDATGIGAALAGLLERHTELSQNGLQAYTQYEFGRCYRKVVDRTMAEIEKLPVPRLAALAKAEPAKNVRPDKFTQTVDETLQPDDILIASFPRSGNTWTRNLIVDIVKQLQGVDTTTNTFDDVEKVIPDIYQTNLDAVAAENILPFRLVKTHARFNAKVKKSIYVFRRPVDVLSSYYHYRIDFENMPATDNIDAFCRHNLGDWYTHIDSYVAAGKSHPDDILFISYEWLHRDTAGALQEMAAFLNLPADRDMCRKAVENQEFKKHRRQSKQFYRKGVVGGGKQELAVETVDFIEQRSDELYARATALTHEARRKNQAAADKHSRPFSVVTLSVHDGGGAGRAATRLHAGLLSSGLDAVMLVASRHDDSPGVRVLNDAAAVPIETFGSDARPGPDHWQQQYKAWAAQLKRYPDRPMGLEMFTDTQAVYRMDRVSEIQAADLIHLHWVAGVVDPAELGRSIGSKPVIWTLHDMNPFTGGCHYAGDCRKYAKTCGDCPQLGSRTENDLSRQVWSAKKQAYQHLNLTIVTPSQWLADCAAHSSLLGNFPIHVIPNGFPLDVFQPGDPVPARNDLGLSPNARVVLFGADSVFNRRKGFRYLLEALRLLTQREQNRELVLVCFGHLPHDAALEVPCRLVALGSLADEAQLVQAYGSADVFVLPSLEDNLPNTAIEALACGVPVVAFDSGGLPEIIEHRKTGYLVKRRHPKDLAEGIDWVLSASAFAQRAPKMCRQKTIASYDAIDRAADYTRLYEQVLTNNAPDAKVTPAQATGSVADELGQAIQTRLADLERNPADSRILLDLGALADRAGRSAEAEIFYTQVLDKDPLNVDARGYYDTLYGYRPGQLTGNTAGKAGEDYLVSAIVSTYNARRFIRGCLEDLEAQTIADRLEIIVVDSGSEQDEKFVVAQMQQQYDNIVYIRTEERETVYGAWNRGIRAARGKYITNANTDDRHSPDALERLAHMLETRPDVVLVYADALHTQTANETFGAHTQTGVFHWHDWDRAALLTKGCFIGPQPMWRRSVHDKYGYFDPDLVSSGDFEFWLRISQQAEKFVHLKMPLGLYLDREDSIEHASTSIRAREDKRTINMYRQAAAEGRIIRRRPVADQSQDPASIQTGTEEIEKGGTHETDRPKGDNIMTTSDQSPYSPETEAALIAYMEEKLRGRVSAAVIHNDLGVMYCRKGDHPKALANFTAATELDPENGDYLKNLADFYYSVRQDSRAALPVYKKLLTLDPVDTTVLTIIGHLHLAEKEFGQAKVYYQRILVLDPGNTEIQSYLENMGAPPQGMPAVQPGDSPDQLYEQVQKSVEQGDVQGACRQLEELVAAYPEYALAYNDLGVLYYQTGNKEKSLAAYQQAVALEPDNLTFKKNLADFKCIELKQLEEAVELYNDILAAQPDDLETLTALGQVCAMLGKAQDARHFFNQALTAEPWNTEVRQLLIDLDNKQQPGAAVPTAEQMHVEAKTLAEDGKSDLSLARLRELVTAYPDLAVGHNDLGVMLYQAGDKAAARYHYEQAVALEPDNSVFRKNLADFICLEQGRVEEAMQIYIELLSRTPDDVEILTTLGQVCEQLEQMDDAARFYEKALNVEPWNADIRQRMEDLQNR